MSVVIKKLPPGEAEGARDLQTWARYRKSPRRRMRKEKPKYVPDAACKWLRKHDKGRTWI